MNKTLLVLYLSEKECTIEYVSLILPYLVKISERNIDVCLMVPPKFYNIIKIELLSKDNNTPVKVYTEELDHSDTNALASYLSKVATRHQYTHAYSTHVDVLEYDTVTDILPDKLAVLNDAKLSAAVTPSGTFFGGSVQHLSSEKPKLYKPRSLAKNNLFEYIKQIKNKK